MENLNEVPKKWSEPIKYGIAFILFGILVVSLRYVLDGIIREVELSFLNEISFLNIQNKSELCASVPFYLRLTVILPLFLYGIYCLELCSKHKYWPLYLAFVLFSFYAFIFYLMPYLPDFEGYSPFVIY